MYSLMSTLPRYRAHIAGSSTSSTTSTSTSPAAQQRSITPTPSSSTDASPDASAPASPSLSPYPYASASSSSSTQPTTPTHTSTTLDSDTQPISTLPAFCAAPSTDDPPPLVYRQLSFAVHGRPLLFRSLRRSDLLDLRRLQEHLFPVRYSDEFYCSLLQSHIVAVLGFLPPLPAPEPLLVGGAGDATEAAVLSVDDASAGSATAPQTAPLLICIALVSYPPPPPARPCSSNPSTHRTHPAYLITLGVSQPYRQLGLATHLLTTLPTLPPLHTAQHWRLHVLESNDSAVRLYVRSGWIVRDRLIGHYCIDGCGYNALEMGWELEEEDAKAGSGEGSGVDEEADDEDGKGTISKRRRTKWNCVRRNWTPGGCAVQ